MKRSLATDHAADTAGNTPPAVVLAKARRAVVAHAAAQGKAVVEGVGPAGKEGDQVVLEAGGVRVHDDGRVAHLAELLVAQVFAADEVELAAVQLHAAAHGQRHVVAVAQQLVPGGEVVDGVARALRGAALGHAAVAGRVGAAHPRRLVLRLAQVQHVESHARGPGEGVEQAVAPLHVAQRAPGAGLRVVQRAQGRGVGILQPVGRPREGAVVVAHGDERRVAHGVGDDALRAAVVLDAEGLLPRQPQRQAHGKPVGGRHVQVGTRAGPVVRRADDDALLAEPGAGHVVAHPLVAAAQPQLVALHGGRAQHLVLPVGVHPVVHADDAVVVFVVAVVGGALVEELQVFRGIQQVQPAGGPLRAGGRR